MNTKMVAKEEVTNELDNLGAQKNETRVLKGRDLKVFATMERMTTCPKIVGLGKSLSKVTWQSPKRRWRMNGM